MVCVWGIDEICSSLKLQLESRHCVQQWRTMFCLSELFAYIGTMLQVNSPFGKIPHQFQSFLHQSENEFAWYNCVEGKGTILAMWLAHFIDLNTRCSSSVHFHLTLCLNKIVRGDMTDIRVFEVCVLASKSLMANPEATGLCVIDDEVV